MTPPTHHAKPMLILSHIFISKFPKLVNLNKFLANGLSFDIAFEEDAESIIQKHPPKRFQKLEEQEQTSPNLSLQRLQEKLDEAEKRRQQVRIAKFLSLIYSHILYETLTSLLNLQRIVCCHDVITKKV